jgi:peptidoglycan L-alanyl-D-glutamate endopeptidase CwlK
MMYKKILFFLVLCFAMSAKATSTDELKRLQIAYPDSIHQATSHYIDWKDGTRMPVRATFPLLDKLIGLLYHVDNSVGSISRKDIINDSYEPFFRKMYGNSAAEVKKNLVTVYWMPNVFGKRYPLRVTTINGIDQKLRRISAQLEKLPPSYRKYLERPAGGFYWRNVASESYLSPHSFGIAIDINSSHANYWLWDWQRSKRPLSELAYKNHIPMQIVEIFEKEGFYWGGRWKPYYDTMHFEYRPELFIT